MRHPILAVALLLATSTLHAKDASPGACVDCHIKERRISVLLSKIDAKNVAPLQAFVPKGLTLKGKHPTVPTKDIPASCLKCHTASSKTIPPFPPLMHGIHLTKPDIDCTSCHKLDKKTGIVAVPSGAEK